MKTVFADTSYFFAIINARDVAHRKAMDYSESVELATVTTAWVLTELADGMASPHRRPAFMRIIESLRANPLCTIIPPSQELFDLGLELYASRPDKSWSLTDCISFVVMRQQGLTEALSGDTHFQQAGFGALLAAEP